MMRILIIEEQSFGLPALTAYDVVGRSRRSYLVRRGKKTVSVSKSGRHVYTDTDRAVKEYRRRLSQSIRRLEEVCKEIEEAVELKRSPQIPVLLYDADGNGVTTMLSMGGEYVTDT